MVSQYFVDTSALAKRYLIESGSKWVISWIERSANNTIVISELTLVEMRSVFSKRLRGNFLSSANAAKLQTDFFAHVQRQYILVAIRSRILTKAGTLVDRYGLRTLDALQLASAIEASPAVVKRPIIFISGDNNLLAAAEGFTVDNPNNHL
jgi:predicted nucleic acid-binding protein